MQNKNAFPYRLPAGEAALDTSATQEPTGTDETEQGHDRVRPQEGLEETSGASGRGVREAELVNRLAGDTHSQEGVAENPKGDETSTETLV